MLTSSRLGVSTWSLNNTIAAGTPLLDIPAQVAAHGLSKLEVCHFHIPRTDEAYLAEFRAALDAAGIEFYALLVDEGDITHVNPAERDKAIALIKHWIKVAAKCGTKRVRVIAGDAVPSEAALRLSEAGLREILHLAEAHKIRVVVENWHQLLDHPAEVRTLLSRLGGRVGFKLDFGNWPTDRKYIDMSLVADLVECTHAKAYFSAPGQMQNEDFNRCLSICAESGFTGPHILIFSDSGDEWESLDQMRNVTLSAISETQSERTN